MPDVRIRPSIRSPQRRRLFGGYPTAERFEWMSVRRLAEDTRLLVGKLPASVAGVAGVPRSGMIPAALLATLLHVPLFEVQPSGRLRRLGNGARGNDLGFAGDRSGIIAIVDDTVYTGRAMHRVRSMLQDRRAVFAAVYARREAFRAVDVFARELPSPHLLEWNLFNSGQFAGRAGNPVLHGGFAVDFDGILCEEPSVGDADTSPAAAAYEKWLRTARPLYLPRSLPVKLIATFRLERWRAETEAWLRRWGIRWERLVMHPAGSVAERSRAWNAACHKGRPFLESGCSFFVESDVNQAREIFEYTRRPVICPAAETIFQ